MLKFVFVLEEWGNKDWTHNYMVITAMIPCHKPATSNWYLIIGRVYHSIPNTLCSLQQACLRNINKMRLVAFGATSQDVCKDFNSEFCIFRERNMNRRNLTASVLPTVECASQRTKRHHLKSIEWFPSPFRVLSVESQVTAAHDIGPTQLKCMHDKSSIIRDNKT
jgi:hypothetical protein